MMRPQQVPLNQYGVTETFLPPGSVLLPPYFNVAAGMLMLDALVPSGPSSVAAVRRRIACCSPWSTIDHPLAGQGVIGMVIDSFGVPVYAVEVAVEGSTATSVETRL